MNFQDLQYHLESLGCTLDHFEDDSWFASNCINGEICIIENLSEYSEVALCHYFYELGISAPPHMKENYKKYVYFRENVINKVIVEKESGK